MPLSSQEIQQYENIVEKRFQEIRNLMHSFELRPDPKMSSLVCMLPELLKEELEKHEKIRKDYSSYVIEVRDVIRRFTL